MIAGFKLLASLFRLRCTIATPRESTWYFYSLCKRCEVNASRQVKLLIEWFCLLFQAKFNLSRKVLCASVEFSFCFLQRYYPDQTALLVSVRSVDEAGNFMLLIWCKGENIIYLHQKCDGLWRCVACDSVSLYRWFPQLDIDFRGTVSGLLVQIHLFCGNVEKKTRVPQWRWFSALRRRFTSAAKMPTCVKLLSNKIRFARDVPTIPVNAGNPMIT